jgi:hypothetical protein
MATLKQLLWEKTRADFPEWKIAFNGDYIDWNSILSDLRSDANEEKFKFFGELLADGTPCRCPLFLHDIDRRLLLENSSVTQELVTETGFTLVQMLCNSNDLRIQQTAVGFLYACAVEPTTKDEVFRSLIAVIPRLLSLVILPDPYLYTHTCLLLTQYALQGDDQGRTLGEFGTIEVIVHILTGSNGSVEGIEYSYAQTLLDHLCGHPENIGHLHPLPWTEIFSPYMREEVLANEMYQDTFTLFVNTFWVITKDEGIARTFMDYNLQTFLISWIQGPFPDLADTSMAILVNLMKQDYPLAVFLRDDNIRSIVSCFKFSCSLPNVDVVARALMGIGMLVRILKSLQICLELDMHLDLLDFVKSEQSSKMVIIHSCTALTALAVTDEGLNVLKYCSRTLPTILAALQSPNFPKEALKILIELLGNFVSDLQMICKMVWLGFVEELHACRTRTLGKNVSVSIDGVLAAISADILDKLLSNDPPPVKVLRQIAEEAVESKIELDRLARKSTEKRMVQVDNLSQFEGLAAQLQQQLQEVTAERDQLAAALAAQHDRTAFTVAAMQHQSTALHQEFRDRVLEAEKKHRMEAAQSAEQLKECQNALAAWQSQHAESIEARSRLMKVHANILDEKSRESEQLELKRALEVQQWKSSQESLSNTVASLQETLRTEREKAGLEASAREASIATLTNKLALNQANEEKVQFELMKLTENSAKELAETTRRCEEDVQRLQREVEKGEENWFQLNAGMQRTIETRTAKLMRQQQELTRETFNLRQELSRSEKLRIQVENANQSRAQEGLDQLSKEHRKLLGDWSKLKDDLEQMRLSRDELQQQVVTMQQVADRRITPLDAVRGVNQSPSSKLSASHPSNDSRPKSTSPLAWKSVDLYASSRTTLPSLPAEQSPVASSPLRRMRMSSHFLSSEQIPPSSIPVSTASTGSTGSTGGRLAQG